MNLLLREILYLVCNINFPYGGNTKLFCIFYFSMSVQWPLVCLLTQKSLSLHITLISYFPGNDSSPSLRFIICLHIVLCGHCTCYEPLVDEDHAVPAGTKPWRLLDRVVLSCCGLSGSLLTPVLLPPHQQCWSVMQSIRCFFCVMCTSCRKIKLLFGCSER